MNPAKIIETRNEAQTPTAQWNALRDEMIGRIKQIDWEVRWEATEPDWWLDMMEVYALLLKGKSK